MTDKTDKPRGPRPKRGESRVPKADGSRAAKRPGFAARRRDDAPDAAEPSGERIAKRLARAGMASRRDAEALIADGRIRVNGQVLLSPAFNVEPGDRIELDGTEIPAPERTRLFLFHKPAGLVTTNRDPEGRRTVFDVLPEGLPRLMTVGRLDINTEGLLLLTNDGGLARVLELPATGWLRRYRVRVHGSVDEARLKALEQGISVDGVFYGAIEAALERTQGSNAWLSVGLREGKNREVKNVMGALGLEVGRLIRVSYGPFQLGELEEGQVQELKGRTLRDQLGERLIEEAGADFEADIRRPFTNKPVARGQEPAPAPVPVQPPAPGEGGLIKNRRRERERFREEGLSRLDTRPDRPRTFGKPSGGKPSGAKGFGGKGPAGKAFSDKAGPDKHVERGRASNVWMAPGARPQRKAKPVEPEGGGEAANQPFRQEDGAAPRKPFRKPVWGAGEVGGGDVRPRSEGASGPWVKRQRPGGEAPRRAGAPGEGGKRGDTPFKPRRRDGGEPGGRFERAGAPERRFADKPQAPRPNGGSPAPRASEDAGRPPRRSEPGDRPERRAGEKPAAVREEAASAKREFKPRRPEGAGGERPFGKGPPRAGAAKPFAGGPRKDAATKPFGKAPRPAGGAKPFGGKPRGAGGGAKPGGFKPGGGGKRPFKPRDG